MENRSHEWAAKNKNGGRGHNSINPTHSRSPAAHVLSGRWRSLASLAIDCKQSLIEGLTIMDVRQIMAPRSSRRSTAADRKAPKRLLDFDRWTRLTKAEELLARSSRFYWSCVMKVYGLCSGDLVAGTRLPHPFCPFLSSRRYRVLCRACRSLELYWPHTVGVAPTPHSTYNSVD